MKAWHYEASGPISAPALVDANGIVYVADLFGNLMALNIADGSKAWPTAVKLPFPVRTGMALSQDEKVWSCCCRGRGWGW